MSVTGVLHIRNRITALLCCGRKLESGVEDEDDDAQVVDLEVVEAHRVAAVAGVLIGILDLNETMAFSFMPGFLLEQGVSQSMTGLIISLLSIGVIVVAPFMFKTIARVGRPVRALVWGMVAVSVVKMCAAFLPFVADGLLIVLASSLTYLLSGFAYVFTEVGASRLSPWPIASHDPS